MSNAGSPPWLLRRIEAAEAEVLLHDERARAAAGDPLAAVHRMHARMTRDEARRLRLSAGRGGCWGGYREAGPDAVTGRYERLSGILG